MKVFDTVGAHVLADFWGCESQLLDDADFLIKTLRQAANMTILAEKAHKFEPQGFTGLLLLAESHLSIHTYPESSYAAIDVFTCGGGITKKAIDYLKTVLQPTKVKETLIQRGIPDEALCINF